MPEDTPNNPKIPPPIGNPKHVQKYLDQLIELIRCDKANLTHSDLKKYDPTTMQDHYRISLGAYDAEISHSINPNSNQDVYLLIFTNVAHIKTGLAHEAILSYLYLTEAAFQKFKTEAEIYFDRKRQEAEDRRFKETMKPIDDIIEASLSEAHKDGLKNDLKSDFLSSHDSPDAASIIH